mmetsp:Transcript_28341/g.49878  ORF Transcript_28341/g.49878 Transcript_28341/m.49878 type:complete len:210 (+) Transcript_28341:3279-3908(+)
MFQKRLNHANQTISHEVVSLVQKSLSLSLVVREFIIEFVMLCARVFEFLLHFSKLEAHLFKMLGFGVPVFVQRLFHRLPLRQFLLCIEEPSIRSHVAQPVNHPLFPRMRFVRIDMVPSFHLENERGPLPPDIRDVLPPYSHRKAQHIQLPLAHGTPQNILAMDPRPFQPRRTQLGLVDSPAAFLNLLHYLFVAAEVRRAFEQVFDIGHA